MNTHPFGIIFPNQSFTTPSWTCAGYKRAGDSCRRFRPVGTFAARPSSGEHRWLERFFSSLAWWSLPSTPGSSVPKRGTGTSARLNSKRRLYSHYSSVHVCRSAYKCGVFFRDLSPKVPLAWLGALPEAVVRARKEGANDNDVIELLGSNVDGPSYDNYECGDVGANTRCYAQVTFVCN